MLRSLGLQDQVREEADNRVKEAKEEARREVEKAQKAQKAQNEGAGKAKAQKAQANVMKFQAPFSLITWYLFQNRPFKMWPIENLFRVLANVRAPSNPRRHHWKSP